MCRYIQQHDDSARVLVHENKRDEVRTVATVWGRLARVLNAHGLGEELEKGGSGARRGNERVGWTRRRRSQVVERTAKAKGSRKRLMAKSVSASASLCPVSYGSPHLVTSVCGLSMQPLEARARPRRALRGVLRLWARRVSDGSFESAAETHVVASLNRDEASVLVRSVWVCLPNERRTKVERMEGRRPRAWRHGYSRAKRDPETW